MPLKTLTKTLFSLSFPLCLGLGMAGCELEPDTLDTSCAPGECDLPPPISGSAIIDCWVSKGLPESNFDVLDCRYEPPLQYPVELAGATIAGHGATGDEFSINIDPDLAGQVVSVTKLDRRGYPLELGLDILFAEQRAASVIALKGLDRVSTRAVIHDAAELAADKPMSARIPFDLWEVSLLGRDEEFSALSFGYDLDVGLDDAHRVGFKTPLVHFGRTESFYVPVDLDTFAVDAVTVFDGGATSVATITGPGTYTVKGGVVEPAIQADYPQPTAAGSQLAECWFETASHGSEDLYCSAKVGAGLDLATTAITLRPSRGQTLRVMTGATPTFIGNLKSSSFPIELDIVGRVEDGIVGLDSIAGHSLRASMDTGSKLLPRMLAPQSIFAPYSLWKVTIDNRTEGFQGALDSFVLELGEGMNDRFATFVDNAVFPFVTDNSSAVFSVASPAGVYEVTGNGVMVVDGEAEEIEFVLRPGVLLVGE